MTTLQYIRKANIISKLEYSKNEADEQVITRVPTKYKSINAAKRESRRLQGSTPGNGMLKVEQHKRQTRIKGNRLVVS